MSQLKKLCITLYVVICYFQAQGADKYTNGNRPYEFGFSIDGEQHRHEKKDENGIIMGEFGFITADGVYHVTVYATDEKGRFKILSMKNIRVKPFPTGPYNGQRKDNSVSSQHLTSPGIVSKIQTSKGQENPIGATREGHSLALPPSRQLSTPYTSSKTQTTKKQESSFLKSCSHCKVPTTTPPSSLSRVGGVSTNENTYKQLSGGSVTSQQNYNQQSYSQHEQLQSQTQHLSSQPNTGINNYPQDTVLSQPNPARSSFNQASNSYGREQFAQTGTVQQNYSPKDAQNEFNVGRQYLKKAYGQQSYQSQTNAKPNSLQHSRAGANYYQELNSEQKQARIPGTQNIKPPQSYTEQSGASVQKSGLSKVNQNYPTDVAQQNYNIPANNLLPQQRDQNRPNYPTELVSSTVQEAESGDRQPKTFKDIIQNISPDQQYKSAGNTGNPSASSQQNNGKPVLIAAQMQIVDKNTNIYHKNSGENEGLPKGLTKGDMAQLLYTFNYTVGFHAHHEEGYTNGAKVGYYYVTGRNGIRTRVDYVADETGFHPKISQEVLDVQSDEVPKPETEKEAKYGLKGYEFKWLYYPVNSK